MDFLDTAITWFASNKFIYFLCGLVIYSFGIFFFFQKIYTFSNESKFLNALCILLSICLMILGFYFIIISFI
ncbi:hypothetical protein KLEB273_gp248 [Bacillus phage vB_BauM_KLEB27-3]|nr:hypothetical protein KLEB273_gp248 [Bacillus phage vB_BauM_KLEB27-3]